MTHQGRIIRDSRICGGTAIFRGTRVTLRTVLASLADGDTLHQILEAYPSLEAEDVQAAIEFAAAASLDDLPISEAPKIA